MVIDHSAALGLGAIDAQKLHKIESAFVKHDLAARGFNFIKGSKLLKNSEDILNISVLDPKVRRKTDRFVYIFEKVSKS